jgi:hypothetical protein
MASWVDKIADNNSFKQNFFIKKGNPFFIHSLRCGKIMDDFR